MVLAPTGRQSAGGPGSARLRAPLSWPLAVSTAAGREAGDRGSDSVLRMSDPCRDPVGDRLDRPHGGVAGEADRSGVPQPAAALCRRLLLEFEFGCLEF